LDKYTRHNPLDGLSANQVIQLFECGSGHKLNDHLRDIAISTVSQHQRDVLSPTMRSTVTLMLSNSKLESFAADSAQRFLGDTILT